MNRAVIAAVVVGASVVSGWGQDAGNGVAPEFREALELTLDVGDSKTESKEPNDGRPALAIGEVQFDLAKMPWLGIQAGVVSDALRVHLGLGDDEGVMVLNVVKGSPADQAGIAQYDIVLEVDGQPVEGGIDDFVASLRELEIGDDVAVSVLHGGVKKELDVELDARAKDPLELDYKFELLPTLRADRLDLSGAVVELDGDKRIRVQRHSGLGLENIEKLLRRRAGKALENSTAARTKRTVSVGDGSFTEEIEVTKDDNGIETVLRVVRANGKTTEIDVRRSSDDDTLEVGKYSSEEDLKKKDPAAYEILQGIDRHAPVSVDGGDVRRVETVVSSTKNLDAYPHVAKLLGRTARSTTKDEPKRQFSVAEDGRVTVKIRKGDGALELHLASVEELEEKHPKLFEYYRALLED